jgi:hypothetical protein
MVCSRRSRGSLAPMQTVQLPCHYGPEPLQDAASRYATELVLQPTNSGARPELSRPRSRASSPGEGGRARHSLCLGLSLRRLFQLATGAPRARLHPSARANNPRARRPLRYTSASAIASPDRRSAASSPVAIGLCATMVYVRCRTEALEGPSVRSPTDYENLKDRSTTERSHGRKRT